MNPVLGLPLEAIVVEGEPASPRARIGRTGYHRA